MRPQSNHPHKPPATTAGFSLLEVLIATAILSLTLLVILQSLAAGLGGQAAQAQRLEAVWLADRLLTQYQQAAQMVPGRYQGRDGRYHYEVRITPQYRLSLTQAGESLSCYLLQISVSWQEQGRTKVWTTQTARLVKSRS